MIQINFVLNGDSEIIEGNKKEKMYDIIKKYAEKINKKIENLYFLFDGNLLRQEEQLGYFCRDQENIEILVYEYEDEKKEEELKQSKDIICPICKEICLINFKDYKINFSNCKNNHCFSKILFSEFEKFQKINESKIICNM